VNNKTQTIATINKDNLSEFTATCLQGGALKVIPLPFKYPYHVATLSETSASLRQYFAALHMPPLHIPMVAGMNPEYIPTDSNHAANLVADQLCQTVYWQHTIQTLIDHGAEKFVVFDPTSILTRIIRWISRQITVIGITTPADIVSLRDL
jgi:[acyl-carrier-protein] S-malonyltransferase